MIFFFFRLQSYPDTAMKRNLNKVSADFEKMLNEEFPNKWDTKSKSQDVSEPEHPSKKEDNDESKSSDTKTDSSRKSDPRNCEVKK